MNIANEIKGILFPQEGSEIKLAEKITTFSIEFLISNIREFNRDKLSSILTDIEDDFRLSIKFGENDAIVLNSNDFASFFSEVDSEIEMLDDEDVLFKLLINKDTNDFINIYSYDTFIEFFKSLDVLNFLSLLKTYQNINNCNVFRIMESEYIDFHTKNIYFTHNIENSYIASTFKCSDVCHFENHSEYPFNADYFNLIVSPEDVALRGIFDKLCLLFSITSIFDITRIQDNQLYYKLNGYKSHEGEFNIRDISTVNKEIYFKIFNWIYSDDGNVNDKIGIVRNIISLSLKAGSISIPQSTFLSIQSGYKTYLKENVNKYIEIRNSIIDEISWISQKSSEIVSSFINSYQNSIFTFLSFFISVFLLQFISTEGDNVRVFTKEITIFSFSFLILSIMYLIFSRRRLNGEKKRLNRKYNNIKKRYLDLLHSNDIEKILNDDSEFVYEIDFINTRMKEYSVIWVLTVIILICSVITVSDFVNWSTILNL